MKQVSISIAETLYSQSDFSKSNDILLSIDPNVLSSDTYISFLIGRNFVRMHENENARSWLGRCLSKNDENFIWAHYELSLIEYEDGRHYDFVNQISCFLKHDAFSKIRDDFSKTDIQKIFEYLHYCFEINIDGVTDIYSLLKERGYSDYLSNLRLVEFLLDIGKVAEAAVNAAELESQYAVDAWGHLALSRITAAREDVAKCTQQLLSAVEGAGEVFYIEVAAAHRFFDIGQIDHARNIIERSETRKNLNPSDYGMLLGAMLRVALFDKDEATIKQIIRKIEKNYTSVPMWIIRECMNFCLNRCFEDQKYKIFSKKLYDLILANICNSSNEYLTIVEYLYSNRQFSNIVDIGNEIQENTISSSDRRALLLKIFESHCNLGNTEQAWNIYNDNYKDLNLDEWESTAVIRFFLELKKYDNARDVIEHGLSSGFEFKNFHTHIIDVARKTGSRSRFFIIINEFKRKNNFTSNLIEDLRINLYDDLILQKVASKENDIDSGNFLKMNSKNKTLISIKQIRKFEKKALYLCTDKNYFFSVMTFISSYVNHNKHFNKVVKVFVFLGNDVPRHWERIISDFCLRIKYPVNVVWEDEFVDENVNHTESYGVFTGGVTLSRACYYRIYAALYLMKIGMFSKAFYIDSDMVCLQDLGDLFEYDFDDKQLIACSEEKNSEIVFACEKHSLNPNYYFNSGLLGFDFSKEKTEAQLRKAALLSEEHSADLVFHDQCALNIAFHMGAKLIPNKFNHFMRPYREDNGDWRSASLVHFLSRPKPWDLSFSRDYRSIWTRHADTVRLLLDGDDYNMLLHQANGGMMETFDPAILAGDIEV